MRHQGRVLSYGQNFSVLALEAMNSHGKSFAIPCRNTCNVVVAPDELGKGIRDGTSGVTLENRDSSVKYIMAIQKRTARKDKSTDAPANSRCIGLADNDEMDVAAYRKGWEMETASRQVGGDAARTHGTNHAAGFLCLALWHCSINGWP